MNALRITAAADSQTASLYLYGYVHEYGPVNVQQVLATLAGLKAPVLHVRIHSNGGSVFEGQAILNALMQYPGEVHTYVDGLAASMASVIFQAGKVRTMADNAMLMVHNPLSWAEGDASVMRQTADLLDKVTTSLAGIYAKRSGQPEADIRSLMDQTTWLSAAEAVQMQLADAISASVLSPAAEAAPALPATGNPASVALATRIAAWLPPDPPPATIPEPTQNDMDTKVLATRLGLPEQATEAQIEARMTELQAQAAAAASQAAQQQAERASRLIAAALADKKIAPAAKAHWEALARQDYDTTQATLDSLQAYTPLASQVDPQAEPATEEAKQQAALEKLRATYPLTTAEVMANLRKKW